MQQSNTTEAAIVFSLLPGKREALAKFTAELAGARREEHRVSHSGVTWESWFLQPTPMGDIVIVYLQAADPTEVFAELAVSPSPFACWFRAQVLELTATDLALLPPFSVPECILHWNRE